jgi:hypothetical protein
LTAPPEIEAPTNEKTLNLPEAPDDKEERPAEGGAVMEGSELEETPSVGTKVNEDEKSEARPCQASTSSSRREGGGSEKAMMVMKIGKRRGSP